MIAGFSTGEVNRNEIVPEKGAPLFNNPTKIGRVEQEQNSVTAPIKTFFLHPQNYSFETLS